MNLKILKYFAIIFACYQAYLSSHAPEQNKLALPGKIVSIHDGDTLTLEFKIQANIRLIDCYAPEIRGEEKESGLKSKQFLESMLKKGDDVIAEIPIGTNIANSISLSRVLANIKKDVDGDGELDDISLKMVEAGYATKSK